MAKTGHRNRADHYSGSKSMASPTRANSRGSFLDRFRDRWSGNFEFAAEEEFQGLFAVNCPDGCQASGFSGHIAMMSFLTGHGSIHPGLDPLDSPCDRSCRSRKIQVVPVYQVASRFHDRILNISGIPQVRVPCFHLPVYHSCFPFGTGIESRHW